MCRYWADIEKGTECPKFTALRLKTVSSINKRQDDVIDTPGGIVTATNIINSNDLGAGTITNIANGNVPNPNINVLNANFVYGNVPNPNVAGGNVLNANI